MFLLEKESFWSGMEGELVSGQLAAILNVPQPTGFLVTAVAKDSPSARAGVRAGHLKATISGQTYTLGGDIILQIAGITLATTADMVKMRAQLGALDSGASYQITLLRAGKVLTLTGRVP